MDAHRWHLIVVGLLVALAFGLRLGYVLENPRPAIEGDALHYDDIAWNLATGHGFSMSDRHLLEADRRPDGRPAPTARRPPLYPLFLSLFYRLDGRDYLLVLIAQAVVGTLACCFIFALAMDSFGRRPALIALALASVYPPFVKYCAEILTEIVFLLLTVAAFWAAHAAVTGGRKRLSFLAGAIGGLAALCRLTAIFFLPLQAVLLLVGLRAPDRARKWLVHMLAYSAAFLLFLSPWPARNYLVFDSFIPGFTSAGYNLFLGTYPPSHGLANIDPRLHPEELKRELEGKGEVESDAIYRRAAFRNVAGHPIEYLKLVGMKTLRAWFVIRPGHDWSPTPLSLAVHGPLLALAVAGAASRWKTHPFSAVLPAAAAIGFTGFHALVVSNLRYNLPAVPFAVILASAALSDLASRVRWTRRFT